MEWLEDELFSTPMARFENAPILLAFLEEVFAEHPWPYWNARLTEADLLGTLAATQLARAPGSQWEYSNFAMMVLSYALAKRSGKDYETLLRERLLAPLGMYETFVAQRPPQVRLARGHLANALPAMPWDFPVDMAGVGGVRATLPDMVRYLEGELGTRESAITPAFAGLYAG